MGRALLLSIAAAMVLLACNGQIGDGGNASPPDDDDTATTTSPPSDATSDDTSSIEDTSAIDATVGDTSSDTGDAVTDTVEDTVEMPACDPAYQGPDVFAGATRVKNLLTGLGLTDDEYQTLAADPTALRGLVATWFDSPAGEAKMLEFFRSAFQQEGFEPLALANQFGTDQLTFRFGRVGPEQGDPSSADLYAANLEESFARTVIHLIKQGRPFSEVLTTDELMLTSGMMVFLAERDERLYTDVVDGERQVVYRSGEITTAGFQSHTPYTVGDLDAAIAYGLLDPDSPNHMIFYHPGGGLLPSPAQCADKGVDTCTTTIDETLVADDPEAQNIAFRAFTGAFSKTTNNAYWKTLGCNCLGGGWALTKGFMNPEDFTDWRLVRIRPPAAGEDAHQFYDLAEFRDPGFSELRLHTPQVGFATTPAWFALWETNEDNQARVQANQMLIVALGRAIDDGDLNFPVTEQAIDAAHADPTSACWGCHKLVDPMRNYIRQSYTFAGSHQLDPMVKATEASFVLGDVLQEGGDMVDLGAAIASHPEFASGWVTKLCHFATSRTCPQDSDELQALAAAFRDSGFDFRAMALDLLSSSLVTGVECVPQGQGDSVSIARKRHFCATLNARLEIDNACTFFAVRGLPGLIPDDGVARGADEAILIADISLITRAAYEKLCDNVSGAVVGSGKRYEPNAPDAAAADMVERLMAIPPSDPRYQQAVDILRAHYDAAEPLVGSREAMQSMFSMACQSPNVLATGF